MPISHRVDPATGILYVHRSGAISTQDEEAALARRRADPLVGPGIAVLVDCRDVEPPDTVEVVRYLADQITYIAAELHCGPVAIVVASEVQFGMARMYESMTELAHPDTDVFCDLDQARVWLESHLASASGR